MIQIEKLFNTYLFTKKKRAKTNDPPHKGEQIEIIYFYDSLFIFLVYLALFFILFSVSCVQLFFLLISIFCSLSICHARWWLTHSVKPKKKFYTITLMRQMNFQCLRKQTGVTFFSSILFLLSDDRKHQFPQMIFSTRFLLLFYSVIHIQWRSLFDGMGTLFVCFFFALCINIWFEFKYEFAWMSPMRENQRYQFYRFIYLFLWFRNGKQWRERSQIHSDNVFNI